MSELPMWRRSPSPTGHIYLRAAVASLSFLGGIALIALAFVLPQSIGSNIAGVMTPSLAGATKLPDTLAADSPLTLTIVLNRADQEGFEAFLHGVQNPGSPAYRQYLSPREQAERFGPSASSYNAVSDWLRQQDFKIIEGSANRLTLTVSTTPAKAEKVFAVDTEKHLLADGTYYANDPVSSIPANLAPYIKAVVGLKDLATPFRVNHNPDSKDSEPGVPAVIGRSNPAKPKGAFADELPLGGCVTPANLAAIHDPRYLRCVDTAHTGVEVGRCDRLFRKLRAQALKECLLSQGLFPNRGGNGPGGNSSSLLAPSGQTAAPAPWLGVDGTGQTIGLLEFDTFRINDMSDYFAFVGDPSTETDRLSEVQVNGGAALGPEEPEVLLDIVAVMTNARGAKVVVYDAPFAGIRTSFQTLFNKMISDGVTVISNSWVYCEDQSTLADVQSIDSVLASAAAAGISVLNSTGDFGSTCVNGSSNTISVPADSPNATAVGGTSLSVGPAFTYFTEVFWNGQSHLPPSGPGGFGVSKFFTRPGYQDAFTASPMRSVPDIALNADPAKGIEICQADAGGCPTGAQYGGTSLAAPLWASFVALLNQAQGQNLGALNPLLYPLGNTNAFHSAASMGSNFAHVGLGSPNLNLIHRALTNKTPGAVSASVSEIDADPNGAVADGTSEAFVVVRLRDANGHTVSGKTVTLSGNAGSHAIVTPTLGVSNVANGAVIFSIKDATPEIVTFTATDTTDGIVLLEQVDVAFVAPSAAAGGISASPTTVNANGNDTATITVTLQDAKGNPAADKLVNISQGDGSSVITATSATTDATGKAQFTASNSVAQTVTYTAVDETDQNLPVPGSATVNFVNASGFCANYNSFRFGTAAPGYAVTTFASSFPLDCFSGIGPIGIAFDASNNLLVGDAQNNNIYLFGPLGGTAGPATLLGNVFVAGSGSLGGMLFAPDGRFYGILASGNKVVEIDPANAAVIRVVAQISGNSKGALAVDPLSGDLFASGFGGIERLSNYSNGPATITHYTSGDFDGIVFAADGTLYAAAELQAAIYRVTGTNSPAPGVATAIAFLNNPDGMALEPNPANSSKPFLYVNRNDGVITRIDTSALPATPANPCGGPCSDIYTGGSRGDFVTVSNDGCLYATQSDRVIKVTKADGTCGLTSASQAPYLVLTPITVTPSPAQGTTVTFSATLKNVAGAADVPITLLATGANPTARLVRSDANGSATITYTGIFAGVDEVSAVADLNGSQLFSNTANVTWTTGKHTTFLTLNQSPASGAPNKSVKVKASLVDVSASPPAPIANAAINFNLAGQSCSGVTDANGQVFCSVTATVPAGAYEVTANFGGTAQFLNSSAKKRFDLIVSPPHQLLNISTRLRVLTGDKALIGGFIITGSESKKVIIRGMGPSLGGAGVPDTLQDPVLELHEQGGAVVVNDNWKDSQRAEIEASGIPPGDDRESAIVATLPPGNHTAILTGKGGTIGAGLVEVYDLSQPADAKLANISTRGFVDTGDNAMIAGIIAGPSTGTLVQVLVRGIGPSLSAAGVPGALQDPTLELHDGNGATLATNDDWKITADGTSQQAEIEATTIPPTDARESAILSPLAPGNYTAILRGKNNTTGIAIVEAYNLQ